MSGGGVTVLAGLDAGSGLLAIVGDQPGSHGLITMFGGAGSSDWSQASTFDASAGGVVVGNSGDGHLEIDDNAQAFANSIVAAQQAGSTAELVIDGAGADENHTTFLKVSDTSIGLAVGQAGTSADVTVLNGSLFDTYRVTVGGQAGNMGPGTVTVQDYRDPATVLHHVLGSLWLVHGQSLGSSSVGGTLDIGGNGIDSQTGGSGTVSIGNAGRLGVEIAMRLGTNGRLDVTGGAATIGTADPSKMDLTPNLLHVLGNTTLPAAISTVSGQGVIVGDILIDSGGNLGPNGLVGGGTGTLSISGSLHVRSGGHLVATVNSPVSGNYDTCKLLNGSLTIPSGTATLDNGAGITISGGGSYSTPQIGDYLDILSAGKVVIGTLNLNILGLPSSGWHYGVVSISGGQALRIQYGTTVHDSGSVSIQGNVLINGMPAANVLVDAEPGISSITNSSGQYVLWVPSGSSGTFTPGSTGFVFGPPLRSFTNLTANLSGQNFLMSDSITARIIVTAEGTTSDIQTKLSMWHLLHVTQKD